ncbi:nuclear transport factor 2 family protein [Comamonas sp. Tr-654]|uniref:nuclear transport factor 2 family protein n=1 Tax=Comamonas sp. Tr-654 TaxID=2608341 RepID=UPI00141EF065|nr:nuclear transport factor 2 family protein [Comamonas sp. Tr-654]NIF85814.1 nuclear transport factor 2 family protein [Comamonas sp. Tr-654]
MPRTSIATRDQLLRAIDSVAAIFKGEAQDLPAGLFADELQLSTSHRGTHQGRRDAHLALRGSLLPTFDIEVTNMVTLGDAHQASASAYIVGSSINDGHPMQFVGVLVLHLAAIDGSALVTELRLQLNSVEGAAGTLADWTLPVAYRQWKPGDAPAVVSSELDAPWHRVPDNTLVLSDEEQMAQAWFRYAWGLDQADHGLLARSFTQDARAVLPPMGTLKGRRMLVSTLKAFRMPWPWMLHAGTPIEIEHTPGSAHARMVLGRLIPGRMRLEDGRRLYGAHYQLELVQSASGDWLLHDMDYHEGWVTETPAP